MTLIVGAESSHLVLGLDIPHLGKEAVVGEEDLADWVVEEVVASDVEEGHAVALVVGAAQGLAHLVHLGLPLCHRKDCLGRGQYPEAVKQHSEPGHQYPLDVGYLLVIRVRGGDVEFLHRTCAA